MTTILAFSDVHADHVTEGLARFDDIEQALTQVTDDAIREKVDHVCFLGDLCDPDKNLSVVRCINLAMCTAVRLHEHDIRSHWLPGNHCVIEDGSGATVLTPFRALQLLCSSVYLHEEPSFSTYNDLNLLALPFTPLSHTYDPVEYAKKMVHLKDTAGLPLVVLSHLVVEGIQPGEETTEMPRGRDIVLPHKMIAELMPEALILQGHYHRRQVFEGVHVVGSLVNLTFGEETHKPGYLIVEL